MDLEFMNKGIRDLGQSIYVEEIESRKERKRKEKKT